MMLIKNGYLVDPANHISEYADVLIQDGKVVEVGKIDEKNHDNVIDANGCVVAPGFVDLHVHFRDPGFTYKEDLMSGSKAAVKGGYTSVVCMANTNPIIDHAELLKDLYKQAQACDCRVYFAGAVSTKFDGVHTCDFKAMKKAGAVCFTDDGKPLSDVLFLKKAMKEIADVDMMISLHEELPEYVSDAGIHAGVVAQEMGLQGATREAEWKIIERDMELAKETCVKMNVQHISSKEGVALVRKGKQEGLKITAEAAPHHFSLTQDAVRIHSTLAKMNPPLREEEDRMAIIKGLQDGTIDVIATDHAPHSKEEKNQEFKKAPSGIIGLETALPLGLMHLVEPGYLSLETLIEKMSVNPSKLLGLPSGNLSVGSIADLVIFDPNEHYIIDSFASKSSNSPFLNQKMQGKVKMTIVNGKIVYQDCEKAA